MTSIKLKIVIWFMESFTIQGMITVSSVLIFLTQISESDLTNYDRLKRTLNEISFCVDNYGNYKDNSVSRHSKCQLGKTKTEVITIIRLVLF